MNRSKDDKAQHGICHLSTVHKWTSTRIFHKELRSLMKHGYKVSFIVQNGEAKLINGIEIIPLPRARGRINRVVYLGFKSLCLAVRQRADVYHFHDPELVLIGLVLKCFKKIVIYDAHEDLPRQILSKKYAEKVFPTKLSSIIEKLENFAAKRFDVVVAATPFIRDRFLTLACTSLDINNFPTVSGFVKSNTAWLSKECAVCYVGGISSNRGIFEMVKAIERTSARLLLAGEFSSAKERGKLIQMPGLENVKVLGQLPWEEIPQVLSRSMAGLVVLHPCINYMKSLPVKMFEYMAAGIPVIASNFPLWKEIIEFNECGICVDPLNSDEISEAVKWIVCNAAEAKRMGENGRKAVKNRYCWETEERKLLDLYESLLS